MARRNIIRASTRTTDKPATWESEQNFTSWEAFLSHVEHAPTKCEWTHRNARDNNASFRGEESFKAALDVARHGWPEGDEIVQAMAASLLTRVTSLVEREHIVYDVEGTELDIASYLKGEPECWMRPEHYLTDNMGTRHIRVVYNALVSGGFSHDIILARGAAVAALVQALEYAGTRVELIVTFPFCAHNGTMWECRVLIKPSDMELDMHRVTFALAHPSMLRRFGFSLVEEFEHVSAAMTSSIGMCNDTTNDAGDIYIAGALLGAVQWQNPASAERWILDTLKNQGVSLTS